jgi:hypothetical protein
MRPWSKREVPRGVDQGVRRGTKGLCREVDKGSARGMSYGIALCRGPGECVVELKRVVRRDAV